MSEMILTGTDVGEPAKQGSANKVAGGYDIIAGGTDIWESSDQFHFAYVEQTGDFDLTARMESLGMADLYTKAGVMVRESLDADSEHIFLLVFPDNSARNKNNGGYEFQYREAAGTNCVAIYPPDYTSEPPEFPVNFPQTWLRLKRNTDDFEALYSADGQEWKLFAKYTLKLSSTVYLGLAVTSHNANETVTAEFRDISLT